MPLLAFGEPPCQIRLKTPVLLRADPHSQHAINQVGLDWRGGRIDHPNSYSPKEPLDYLGEFVASANLCAFKVLVEVLWTCPFAFRQQRGRF